MRYTIAFLTLIFITGCASTGFGGRRQENIFDCILRLINEGVGVIDAESVCSKIYNRKIANTIKTQES